MDSYLSDFKKMVLVVESLKEYKQTLVDEEGIGEDITFNLFGWRGDQMVVVAQLSPGLMNEKATRLKRLVAAATVFRTGFGCEALSFGAEGFCVVGDGEHDESIPLKDQFATNKDVQECITVLHVGQEVDMAAVPYRYDVGRKVVFGNPAKNPEPEKFGVVTESFKDIVKMPVTSKNIGQPYFTDQLVVGLESFGFQVTVIGE
jgi:hypothetical protein